MTSYLPDICCVLRLQDILSDVQLLFPSCHHDRVCLNLHTGFTLKQQLFHQKLHQFHTCVLQRFNRLLDLFVLPCSQSSHSLVVFLVKF